MKIDALVAEIGSTTTILNAFDGLGTGAPRFLGSGQAATTVTDGDVCVGLNNARAALCRALGEKRVDCMTMLATGSAAGGLRMSVHGLVRDMTVRAAEAAALGAGAVLCFLTAGRMRDEEITELKRLAPKLILLAGGTDYGERDTALYNLERIGSAGIRIPLVYCGNIQNIPRVKELCAAYDIPLSVTENVYPRLDVLNVEPVRVCIQEAFERHIVQAPGMEHIRDLVDGAILPTPGSVMLAAKLLYEQIGDLCVLDIGGATTDVHSVTEGSEEIARLLTAPEPFAKRTVEGDLGLYVNAAHLIDRIGRDKLSRELDIDMDAVCAAYRSIPESEAQFRLTERLCLEAGLTALRRHCGSLRYLYTPQGRQTVAEGKDLSCVRWLIGTGGALTRLPHREALLRSMADLNENRMLLFPKKGSVRLLFDNDYIMASVGALSKAYPLDACHLLQRSLGL